MRENRLTSRAISDDEVVHAIEVAGRGWVVEVDRTVVGFAIGNAQDGNIWALFVDPDHEGRGHGRRLHDTMVAWLWSCGLRTLWLSTEPGTRAQRFYSRAGWTDVGCCPVASCALNCNGVTDRLLRDGALFRCAVSMAGVFV